MSILLSGNTGIGGGGYGINVKRKEKGRSYQTSTLFYRMFFMDIPVWERYMLTVEEAAQYFRIGETKLRRLIQERNDADFIIWNGNRAQIKRKLFEQYLNRSNVI